MFFTNENFGLPGFDDVALLPNSPLIDQKGPRFDLDIVGKLSNPIEFGIAEPFKEGQFPETRRPVNCLFSLSEHNRHLSAWTGASVRDDGRRIPLHLTGGIHGLGTL